MQHFKSLGQPFLLAGAFLFGATHAFAQQHEAYPSAYASDLFGHFQNATTLTDVIVITPSDGNIIEVTDSVGFFPTGAFSMVAPSFFPGLLFYTNDFKVKSFKTKDCYILLYPYWTFFIYRIPFMFDGDTILPDALYPPNLPGLDGLGTEFPEIEYWKVCFAVNQTFPEIDIFELPWDLKALDEQKIKKILQSYQTKWNLGCPSEYAKGEVIPYGSLTKRTLLVYDFTRFTELQMLYLMANKVVVPSHWSGYKEKIWKDYLAPTWINNRHEGWKEFEPGGRFADEEYFLPLK
jgi:hypothetical protein